MKPLTWNNLSALRLQLLNWFHKVVVESLSQVLLNLSQLNWFFLATDTRTDSSESRLASINAKRFLSFDRTLNHVFGVNWVIFLPWFRNIYRLILSIVVSTAIPVKSSIARSTDKVWVRLMMHMWWALPETPRPF